MFYWSLSLFKFIRWLTAAAFLIVPSFLHAAVLTWNPNPETDSVAYYTVYIESPVTTIAHQVKGSTSFELIDLLPNVPYTLHVTATSVAGLESERSEGLPYIISTAAPPIILSQPAPVAAPLGSPISISFFAAGMDLQYQWFMNGEPLPGETNPALFISDLTLSAQGSYHAAVWNLLGRVETDQTSVTVAHPPLIRSSPQSATLTAGESIYLTASTFGTPPFTYQWFKDDQPLLTETDAFLPIIAAEMSDSGAYRVEISNVAGTVTSGVADVTVLAPPYIVTSPTGGYAVRGSSYQLSVLAEGSGPLAFQWFLNNSLINGATGSVHQINSVSDAHTGSYHVEVLNSLGIASSRPAEIRVLPPITISRQPLAFTNLLIGDELRLSVQAGGPSSLSYQWFHESLKLEGQTHPDMVLSNLGSADGGNYSVVVSSLAQSFISSPARVTMISEASAIDCNLAMSKGTSGQLSINAFAPPNSRFDLQLTESLGIPNWRRVTTVTTDATGRTTTFINVSQTGNGFVRAVPR